MFVNLAIAIVRDGWDDGDTWGSALNALFTVAEVMDAAGIPVPEELEYRRSPLDHRTVEDMADEDAGNDILTFDLASEYLAGRLDAHTLTLAALTLNRYTDAARAAGLDY